MRGFFGSQLPHTGPTRGTPTEDPRPRIDGVWQRRYAGGWVAVNTSAATRSVTPPAGLTRTDGSRVDGAVTLAPRTGAVLLGH